MNEAMAIRAMNVLAYATSKGKHIMVKIAMSLCQRYGASEEQIETAVEHGQNVAAGVDYPNWRN